MPSTTWKGHITFGLVSIPIKLYPAARKERVEFHQIHKACQTRLQRPLYCPHCDRQVDNSEVIKGYEYEKGRYLLIDKEEIQKMKPETGGTMEISEFVELSEIDPLYYDTSYLAVPDKSGEKPYRLLVETMEQTSKAAIATFVMYQRSYLVVIRPRTHGLTLHTMYFADEIREVAEYGHGDGEVNKQELKLAKELIDNLSGHFQPEQYHDKYQEELKALVEAKLKGKQAPVTAERKPAPVINMMEALKKSLAEQEQARRSAKETRQKARKKAS